MDVPDKSRLFLDANVFIAGCESLKGGSGVIIRTCQKNLFQAVCTKLILQEAEWNIRKKLSRETLLRFYKTIAELPLIIHRPATQNEIIEYTKIVHQKDAHVLASAISSQCEVLITLDKKHFHTPQIAKAHLKIKIVTPAQFLKDYIRNQKSKTRSMKKI